MTRADGTAADRKRGSVRVRGGSLQVRVFAGVDPVTGRDRYLSESVKGTDRAARRQADKVMARLQAEVDGQRSAQSSVTLGYTLDEWLGTVELEDSTRDTYVGYIERTIRPDARRRRDLEAVHADAGDVLRRAAPVPDALQRPPVRRAPSRRRARLRPGRVLVARLPADGGLDRPADPRRHQRCAERGRPLGLDRHEPGAWRAAAPPAPAAAGPAVAVRSGAARRRGVRRRRRLGHPRVARDDHRDASRRGLRAALVAGGPGGRDRGCPAQLPTALRRRHREGHQDAPDAPDRAGQRERRSAHRAQAAVPRSGCANSAWS